jgi:hypothetical protein
MRLNRFNEAGITRFNQFLDSLAANPTLAVPIDLLADRVYVEEISPGIEIETRQFANRMEAARYLDGIVSEITGFDALRDVGLWSWLTLLYFDQICPQDGHGCRNPKQRARYVPAVTDYTKYYRHLLAGPYRVFRAHRDNPDRALVLLCGPLHKPGEIVEQMVARQEIITNQNAVELATNIYYDPRTQSFKRGAASKSTGSARRLADILNQFDVTWDIYSIPVRGILSMLPSEFDRFIARG